jgi:hypothetical protein
VNPFTTKRAIHLDTGMTRVISHLDKTILAYAMVIIMTIQFGSFEKPHVGLVDLLHTNWTLYISHNWFERWLARMGTNGGASGEDKRDKLLSDLAVAIFPSRLQSANLI